LAIIICPTRELADQVYKISQIFNKRTGIKSQLLTGGITKENFEGFVASKIFFKNYKIVCTPVKKILNFRVNKKKFKKFLGRLLEILKSQNQLQVNTKNLEILILDEGKKNYLNNYKS
jgi:superfamily II DNA/RNA helicase